MSDDPEGDLPEDVDTGPPIEVLAEMSESAAPGLLAAIRNSIDRRRLAAQVAEVGWFAPVLVIIEFLRMAFALFQSPQTMQEENDDAGD